jgi:hypothetical protein
VRDGQPRLVDRIVAEDEEVEIDRPGPPPLPALSPEPSLDLEQHPEERVGRQVGLDPGGGVEKAGLGGDPDRLGLVNRRDGRHPHALLEQLQRLPKRRVAIAEVGTERDVRGRQGRSATTAANPTGDSRATSGLRTRTRTAATGKRSLRVSASAVANASSSL